MKLTVTNIMTALSRVGGSVESLGHNLAIVRFDVPQVGVGTYVMVDTLQNDVLAAGEKRSEVFDEVWKTS